MPTGLYASQLCRAGALLIMCATLAGCFFFAPDSYQQQKNISTWEAAGKPPVVSCRYPFEITPANSGNMEPQAYTSMRDFSQAAISAQAPIWECGVIGGSDAKPDATPDAAQIARMNWGRLGYVLLHAWHPGAGYAYYYTGGGGYYAIDPPPAGPGTSDDYYANPSYSYQYGEPSRYSDKIIAAYSAWYLAYQRIPQDDVQAKRQGVGLYAMQGFRCAIHMRDFPAARRYWALVLSTNPESTDTYAQLALQSFFQGLKSYIVESGRGPDYLNIPQDIRSAIWDAAWRQSYSGMDGRLLSMAQIENAAQARTLDKILSGERIGRVPLLSVLYCPAFYPDFDPIPITVDYKLWIYVPSYELRHAAERATRDAGKAGK